MSAFDDPFLVVSSTVGLPERFIPVLPFCAVSFFLLFANVAGGLLGSSFWFLVCFHSFSVALCSFSVLLFCSLHVLVAFLLEAGFPLGLLLCQ